jgi:hypothetical protein
MLRYDCGGWGGEFSAGLSLVVCRIGVEARGDDGGVQGLIDREV